MAKIINYETLIVALEGWADDDTLQVGDSWLDYFVINAESEIFRRLRGVDRIVTYATGNTVGGTATISKPTRYNGIKHISLDYGARTALSRMNLDQATDHYAHYQSGKPEAYVEHASTFELFPTPDANYDVTIVYYSIGDSIVAQGEGDPDTNDILVEYPDLYLYASLVEMYTFLRDSDGLQVAAAKLAVIWESVELDVIRRSAMGRPRMKLDRGTP